MAASDSLPQSGALHAVLVCPEKILFEGAVVMAGVPGVEGEAGLRYGHAPLLALLGPGPLTLELPDGEKKRFVIFGGFAETDGKKAMLLVEEALELDALDQAEIAKEIAEAREDIALGGTAAEGAQERLTRAQTKARVLTRFAGQSR